METIALQIYTTTQLMQYLWENHEAYYGTEQDRHAGYELDGDDEALQIRVLDEEEDNDFVYKEDANLRVLTEAGIGSVITGYHSHYADKEAYERKTDISTSVVFTKVAEDKWSLFKY